MVCGASLDWQSWEAGVGEERDRAVPVGAVAGLAGSAAHSITTLDPLGPGSPPCPSDVMCRKEAIDGVVGSRSHFLGDRHLCGDRRAQWRLPRRSALPPRVARQDLRRNGSRTSRCCEPCRPLDGGTGFWL
jgi:hypothetical protein